MDGLLSLIVVLRVHLQDALLLQVRAPAVRLRSLLTRSAQSLVDFYEWFSSWLLATWSSDKAAQMRFLPECYITEMVEFFSFVLVHCKDQVPRACG